MSDAAVARREQAVRRLKVLLPALFALGFLFYTAITVYPLAGMPGPPPSPSGGVRPLLVWIGTASASGLLFALFGALVVAVSSASDDG